ncbi:MAG: hypothetical protein IPK17_30345 [Chloroflexi bacterium]|uniref:hypothetical protein n=1 Tax=Candidatus Flexifilum breve TaxID=3140694 RepID=UPI003137089D|nr:hypothetical protein [Chloroflexota bacterium]
MASAFSSNTDGGLLRASNTEPVLSLRFEATSEAGRAGLPRSVRRPRLRTIRKSKLSSKCGARHSRAAGAAIQRAPRCPPLINSHAKVTHQQLEVQDR